MTIKQMTAAVLVLAISAAPASGWAAELTPQQRAEYAAKAETASRLVAYGQATKDADMLRAAAKLMQEIGPVAKEVKDGKPVNHDVNALLTEAEGYAGQAKPMSSQIQPTQCSWFYNCDAYNNCFWDQWC